MGNMHSNKLMIVLIGFILMSMLTCCAEQHNGTTATKPYSSISPSPEFTTTEVPFDPRGSIIFNDADAIYIVDIEKNLLEQITDRQAIYSMSTAVANGSVYFLSDLGSSRGILDVYRMKQDGSNIQRLTNDSYYDFWLASSPDGKRIAFVSDRHESTGHYDTVVIDYGKEGLVKQILSDEREKGPLSWSPDGQKLALFVEEKDKTENLYIVDADGRNLLQLTDSGSVLGGFHAWSPDGNQIAIKIGQDDNVDLYLIDIRSRVVTRLTQVNGIARMPVWSPDGSTILFEVIIGENVQLCKINSDSSGMKILTEGPWSEGYFYYYATWSPDNQYIAYIEKLPNNDVSLNVMNKDGTKSIRLVPDASLDIPDGLSWLVPSTSSSLFQVNDIYNITSEGSNLNLHTAPLLSSLILRKLQAGELVTIIAGPQSADGYTWWQMRTQDGLEGWAVENPDWYEPIQ